MSNIGRKPLLLPDGVSFQMENTLAKVQGPKGSLELQILEDVIIKQEEGVLTFSIKDEEKRNLRGLYRSLVENMVLGVSEGFQKKLLIIWVGYAAKLEGKTLVLSLGFAHKVNFEIPEGIDILVEQDAKGNTILTISGINKELVGEVSAKIRSFRKPEPYKGKGIRYMDEVVRLKAGKAAK